MRIPPPLSVDARDLRVLREWISSGGERPVVARRARIVLLSREGFGPSAIAAELGCSKQTVITWRQRYRREGLAGLHDAPRSGRPSTVDVAAVVRRTLDPPGPGPVRWSTRRLAAELGISNVAVANVWRSWGIVPGIGGTVRLATDPAVDAPVSALAGLHLDPPVRVLAVLVEAGDRDPSTVPVIPARQRPGLGSRLAELDAGAHPEGFDAALVGFVRALESVARAGRITGSGPAGAAPLRLGLLVDGPDDAVRRCVDPPTAVALHRVPAGLEWDRVVRVACLVAGASAAGAASVARLHDAVADHPSGEPFSWVDTIAT